MITDLSTVPPALLPGHLFRSRRGSYTGAVEDHAGVFEQAHGGTLLLDEIANLDLEMQLQLLLVIERGQLVFQYARKGEPARAAATSELAVRELALVNRAELYEEDAGWYEAVAVRVGASRWAAEPPRAGRSGKGELALKTHPGQPGETCVSLVAPGARPEDKKELFRKCSYGLVWTQSLRRAPRGQALVVSVQPLPSWNELWIFHSDGQPDKPAEGWRVDTLSPATADPHLGNIELAGFSPDGTRALIAREAEIAGVIKREFQVVRLATLQVETQARSADRLAAFRSWQSADWQSRTLALH